MNQSSEYSLTCTFFKSAKYFWLSFFFVNCINNLSNVFFWWEVNSRNSRISDFITFDSFFSVLNSDNFFLDCLLTNNIISCYSLQSIEYASWFIDFVFLTFSFQANFIVLYLCLATWSVFWIYTSPFSAQGHQSIQELDILAFLLFSLPLPSIVASE